jgi:predicted house-cleaning noncanonical NTP pyrophosphatase (MazG superfamily)
MALESLKRKIIDAEAREITEKLMVKIDELIQEARSINEKLDRLAELLEVLSGEPRAKEKRRA